MTNFISSLFFSIFMGCLFAIFAMDLKSEMFSLTVTPFLILEFLIRAILGALVYKMVTTIIIKSLVNV